MEQLERLTKATRELRDLGATSVKISVDEVRGASIEATFPATPPLAEPEKPLTPEERAKAYEDTLTHSASF